MARTDRAGPYIQRLRNSRVAAGSAVLVIVLAAATQFTGALGDARQLVGRVLLGGASPACAAAIRAYALALTDPVALGALVRDNAPFFAADGGAIACYRRFAAVLVANNDLTQIEALRDRAEAERQTGLRFDRAAYTADLAETVQELSDALPALAKGDDGPFRGTKAYDSAQAYLALSKRSPDASAGIAVLVAADQAVLRELAERLDPQPSVPKTLEPGVWKFRGAPASARRNYRRCGSCSNTLMAAITESARVSTAGPPHGEDADSRRRFFGRRLLLNRLRLARSPAASAAFFFELERFSCRSRSRASAFEAHSSV